MPQLPESDRPLVDRLAGIRDSLTAGCTVVEVLADVEVAASVVGLDAA